MQILVDPKFTHSSIVEAYITLIHQKIWYFIICKHSIPINYNFEDIHGLIKAYQKDITKFMRCFLYNYYELVLFCTYLALSIR